MILFSLFRNKVASKNGDEILVSVARSHQHFADGTERIKFLLKFKATSTRD